MIEALLITLQLVLIVGLIWMRRWKMRAFEYYETKSTAIQREWLRLVGVEAYYYAERTYHNYDGPAKLNEAIKYVLDRAEGQGLIVTYPEVRAVVERACSEVSFGKQKVKRSIS